MVSTTEIVIIVALIICLGLAIWWLAVAYRYGETLTSFSYARGANIDTGTSTKSGNTGDGSVNLTCDPDREICVWRATAICTGAENALPSGNREAGPEPISNGINNTNTSYGDFDPITTFDLTSDLGGKANGQQSVTYNFKGSNLWTGTSGSVCPFSQFDQTTQVGVRPQLIAAYSCIPKGTPCISYKPPTPPPPKGCSANSTCNLDKDCNGPKNGSCFKNSQGVCNCVCNAGYGGKNCTPIPPTNLVPIDSLGVSQETVDGITELQLVGSWNSSNPISTINNVSLTYNGSTTGVGVPTITKNTGFTNPKYPNADPWGIQWTINSNIPNNANLCWNLNIIDTASNNKTVSGCIPFNSNQPNLCGFNYNTSSNQPPLCGSSVGQSIINSSESFHNPSIHERVSMRQTTLPKQYGTAKIMNSTRQCHASNANPTTLKESRPLGVIPTPQNKILKSANGNRNFKKLN
jgi:hypothetical protein